MIDQQLFNIVIAVCGALSGWWMKAMWDAVKDLQKADMNITNEVTSLKVLIVGEYVKQEMFDKTMTALFAKLDRIEDKTDARLKEMNEDKNGNK